MVTENHNQECEFLFKHRSFTIVLSLLSTKGLKLQNLVFELQILNFSGISSVSAPSLAGIYVL